MRGTRRWGALLVCGAFALGACSSDSSSPTTGASAPEVTDIGEPATAPPVTSPGPSTPEAEPDLHAGASSRSVLPTVEGERAYLDDAPGWPEAGTEPNDIGVFVPEWDQGRVDVGNGSEDGSWVHDDLRVTALAVESNLEIVVFVSADVYMVFAADAAEIEQRALALMPAEIAKYTHVIVSATHNHHGPDTAFSVNDDWYDMFADQAAGAAADSVAALEPATLTVDGGEHRFGVSDGRDPIVLYPALLTARFAAEDGSTIATVVQWASHPESTLGWKPPVDITEQCAIKGWEGDDCSAEGRIFSADYPGVLRDRIQSADGGEVVYFNGPIGSQIGPGDADVWIVDAEHPAAGADGVQGSTAPVGAQPVAGATDFRDRNMARPAAIGTQLALAVEEQMVEAREAPTFGIEWTEQPFYTRLTNIGFRVLLADGDLGWQTPDAFNCTAKPFTDDNCISDGGAVEDDPVLTPLVDSQIRVGDVLKTRLVKVTLDTAAGGIGFLFMPGELPPELVVGLPATFNTDPAPFYTEPENHAVGADYVIPGYLGELTDDELMFTIGLGGDELGYFVPINEVRLKCLDLALPAEAGYTCQRLFDEGWLVTPDAVAGPVCRQLTDPDPALAATVPTGDAATALVAVCRYGQALGRELGEPAGHYEETNSAGWDLVDDVMAAAETLFGKTFTSGGIA